MTITILHPAVAHEQACDLHCGRSVAQIGEQPRDGFRVGPGTDEEARIAEGLWRAWWQSHYNGRPSRSVERGLALMRAAVALPEDEALEYVKRSLRL